MSSTFALFFIFPVIAGVLILLAGLIFLFIDSRRQKKAGSAASQAWETTGGKIVASRLDQHETRRADASGEHIDISYKPIIEYVYTVKEIEYRGNKVFSGGQTSFGQDVAQEILNQHPLNSYLPVSYNVQDPANSSLENHPERVNYTNVIGLVLTALGILVCCYATFMAFIATGKY